MSGVPATFSFFITLHQKRNIWFDKEIADLSFTHSIEYNNLKKEYTVIRSWNDNKPVITKSFAEAQKLMRHYYHLSGVIAKAEGDYQTAVQEFEKAISLLSSENFKADMHILYFDALALTYVESGDLKKAQKVYERITGLKTGRLRWGDLYVKSFYKLGKLHEQQRNEAKG